MNRKIFAALILFICGCFSNAQAGISNSGKDVFSFHKGENVTLSYGKDEEPIVYTAIEIFIKDYSDVFDGLAGKKLKSGHEIVIGTLGGNSLAEKLLNHNDIKKVEGKFNGFIIKVKKGKLIILGSDSHGTAYGVLDLSRRMGVSPWKWWADVVPGKLDKLTFEEDTEIVEYPSVKYRGIFINDEDFGMTPWSYKNYDKSKIKGQIGPKTHKKIFELLLRLRANTFWPAMHRSTVPFYLTPGNKEMADKYGIYVGSSHCEPMVRNTNGEWHKYGKGSYNYISNKSNVLKFWEERVKKLNKAHNIYTLGMRGIHDGRMNGVKSAREGKKIMPLIFKDQRNLIAEYINPDVSKVPQVFIPYKEVLDIYNLGLEVPDDVTLMWCDDNYGYIRHFPDSIENGRSGGNGIYYHISYWGRPHDYLWLFTTSPSLIYYQMKTAYDKGIRSMWILNVGDIKPAEFGIEEFLDLAWNINCIKDSKAGIDEYTFDWLKNIFGEKIAAEVLPLYIEYYRLAYILKPEYTGHTRSEERDPAYKKVSDLPWSYDYINSRIEDYLKLSAKVKYISDSIPENKKAAWFELVEYPLCSAAEMNKKNLYGQLARHGLVPWSLSDSAYYGLVSLNKEYDSLLNGKWKYMMNFKAKNKPEYLLLKHDTIFDNAINYSDIPDIVIDGTDYAEYEGTKPKCYGLGYNRRAVNMEKGSEIIYIFEASSDSVLVTVNLLPVHPVDGKHLRYSVSVDSSEPYVVDYNTKGRSEEWKRNVLRNRAVRRNGFKIARKKIHYLKIRAVDEGVVIDAIEIRYK